MEQSNQSKKVLLSVIGVAILVVAVVGVSFAFFNYTRTGAPNTVKTGHIYFTSTQSEIPVNNLFPVAASAGKTVATNGSEVGTIATITITGNTTYSGGLDYRITAQDVNLAVAGKTMPISVYVEESQSPSASVTEHHVYSYNANSAVTSTNVIQNNDILAEGHIEAVSEGTNVNHVITIRTYLDRNKIAISDTYDATNGVSDNMGTKSEWINGRTVFTTDQWNKFHGDGVNMTNEGENQVAPVSFKIRVEASEANDGQVTNYAYSGATHSRADS